MAYNEFAYIYDRLMHADIDYRKWCDYIENIFAMNGCDPDSVCELACGTGNITSIMERRGYKMCGVDISADMIEEARRKLRRTELICQNMASFVPDKKYDAFLCMIDGINYVIAPKSVFEVFSNVRKSLNDDGIFIFDVSSRYKLKNIIGDETFIHSERDIFYSWQNRYIERYNISDMYLNFFVEQGDMYERFEERHLQRAYSERELRALLKEAGFSNIRVYDELSFDAPTKKSERLVFVCK